MPGALSCGSEKSARASRQTRAANRRVLLSLVEPPEGVPGAKAFAKRITDPGRETGGDMRVTRVDGCVRPSWRIGHIARDYAASANRLRQHGHSPSNPRASAANAVGCGRVMIALNASGARWA